MGISYGGISQLFTAQLNPPHLAAISPLSVLDATATTLYPGGVLNTGFAVAWAQERQHEALPAGPNAGQPYAYKRIQGGDTTCKANQALHGEAANLNAKIAANSHYNAAVADPLDPVTFVHKIKVPVFMACQWQDEQTGGHCPELVRHFTGTNRKWFTFTNGAHIDSLDPYTYNRWYDFLQLYVAHQAPLQNAAITHAAAPVIYQAAMGLPQTDVVTMPADPIQSIPTYDAALAAFNQLPRVRVLFDNGAGQSPTGTASAGDPYPGYIKDFATFPIPGTTARTWYLRAPGALGTTPADDRGDQLLHRERERPPPHQLREQHRRRRPVGQRVAVAVELAAASRGQRGLVRLRAAHREHHGHRQRRGVPLGAIVDPRRRPAGDDQRGATRRDRDVRAERLDARERTQAVDRFEQHVQAAGHAHRADPQLHAGRRVTDAGRAVREGRRAALLPGPRVPRGVAHPRHDLGAERLAAGVVVRADDTQAERQRRDRVLQRDAVEPRAPGRARRECADTPPGVPEPAQRALPELPADREQRRLARKRAANGVPRNVHMRRPPRDAVGRCRRVAYGTTHGG